MKNEEKARELANEMVELAHYSSLMTPDEQRNNIMNVADVACMKMAEWKEEQHEQLLIDLNCKLEEQQENYEELKKRYDEVVERERIASKIIEQKRLDFLELEAKADVWKSSLRDAKNEIKLLKNKIEELCKK